MKKNGVFLFVMSHVVPEIFKIFVLCKLGTDDVIRCDNMEVKTQSNLVPRVSLLCLPWSLEERPWLRLVT